MAGSYTVRVTVTDDAGCSNSRKFTGQTVSCNGGPQATVSRQLTIASVTPPPVKITEAKISAKRHRVIFTFKALTAASWFQCALIKRTKHITPPKPHFLGCMSPKTYKHLKAGKYTFEVRALNAHGRGKLAEKNFTIT